MFQQLPISLYSMTFAIISSIGCNNQNTTSIPNTQSPALASWNADSSMEQNLDVPVQVGSYSIRMPKSFAKCTLPYSSPGTNLFGWVGEQRLDGTSSMVSIMT